VFATLGAIGLLVLADFGGPLRRQARAYVIATAFAAVLVALGTAVSEHTFAAAALLFVVALCVSLSTVMGRNVATGGNGVLLFFLVACAVPAPISALDSRVLGVLLGGGLSLVAALTLWPQTPRDPLRAALADATEALARLVGQVGRPPSEQTDSLAQPVSEALAGARPERAEVSERPTLASERDHAQLRMGYGLSRLQLLCERLLHRAAPRRAVADAERPLAEELRRALDTTAAALRGNGTPPAAELPLDAARAYRERANAALVRELAEEEAGDTLAVGADRAVLANELATSVGGIVSEARVVVGVDRFPARAGSLSDELNRRLEGVLDRLVTIASSTLSPRSVAMQNSIRLALGLALARLLGGVLDVENAFWVLFATLSVVRTNAPLTGATAVQAVFGTVMGFAIALPLLLAVGTSGNAYLYVLPIVMVAGLLAGSINLIWGQAGFTVLVLVLFNLVEPVGWEIGIIRVQDVALGAAVGVLIGLAAWPRGAAGQLAESLAEAIKASWNLVAAVLERRLRPDASEPLSRLRSQARAKTLRADGVLAVFATERPKNPEDVAMWEQASMFAHTRWYGAEMLAGQPMAAPPPEAADLVAELMERVQELGTAHAQVATAIAERTPPPPPVPDPIDIEFLDSVSRELAAHPPVDDPWAARGVVDILRTRALIAEITISLAGLRNAVDGAQVADG